jgi:MYXO-CTERM domain-containing protein
MSDMGRSIGRALRRLAAAAVGIAALVSSRAARADDVLHVGTPTLDRPTLVALGVVLPITGDDDYDSTVSVRYREKGTSAWRDALPLLRVHPDVVVGIAVAPQFAGTIFDLLPATTYEIELHAVDPDGVDQTLDVTGSTRAVPGDPKTPATKHVSDAAGLAAALSAAQPGDVIVLAKGTYAGTYSLSASGTSDQPIVVRGEDEEQTILDGGGCTGCNVLEVYGSFVHVENLTIAHASRALRFQGQGAEANVVRRVHIRDTTLGIGSKPDQKDFYLCDDVLEGRLSWPSVYADDGGAHANDDGIHVEGDGHVVCHNQIAGYGDAIKIEQDGARSIDFYGNEVLSAYDNAVELDGTSGNARCFRNRFTNTYATISFQPIFGGPAYAIRNVVVNVANEQMKLHALGTTPPEEPSGMLVYHNTFVSSKNALNLQTTATSHHFAIENNLFVSAPDPNGRTMDWTGVIDDGTFDYDGFYPDGTFDFHYAASGYQKYASFAAAQASGDGFEPHGIVLGTPIFANGLVAPADYTTAMQPPDATLAGGSNAIDHGLVLPDVNDGYTGAGPDLGALEVGCPMPIYGVRPQGIDETNEPLGCGSTPTTDAGAGGAGGSAGAAGSAGASDGGATEGGAGSGGGGAGSGAADGAAAGGDAPDGGDSGGCGCHTAGGARAGGSGIVVAALVAVGALRRRRRAR